MKKFLNLVDSHCHLDFPDFTDDLDDVVNRARERGVGRMVTICTSLDSFSRVSRITELFQNVFMAAGTHPHKAGSSPLVSVEELVELSSHPKMVGIGETGLDYHYTKDSSEQQKHSLVVHIEAARQTKLPLIIHSRDADFDMAELLSKEYAKGRFSCVMHCFSSSSALAQTALDLGFYLSMSGIVTFRNAESLRHIFASVPLNRILIETDSPYLAPVPNRGKRNEPAFVADLAEFGAKLFNCNLEEFANITTANFDRLFKKAAIFGN